MSVNIEIMLGMGDVSMNTGDGTINGNKQRIPYVLFENLYHKFPIGASLKEEEDSIDKRTKIRLVVPNRTSLEALKKIVSSIESFFDAYDEELAKGDENGN